MSTANPNDPTTPDEPADKPVDKSVDKPVDWYAQRKWVNGDGGANPVVATVVSSLAGIFPDDPPERESEPEPAPEAFAKTGARSLDAINHGPPEALLVGRISPVGHTMLYGPGNAGKGVLTSSWLSQHVEEGGRVLILDFEDHPEEWARRVRGLIGATNGAVLHVSPLRMGKLDWEALYATAHAHGSTLVVIDSVAYAAPGGDPSDPAMATAYSAAIQPFGLPVLSLAHTSKNGDIKMPFGSVFWHAGARVTWSLMPATQQGESRLHNRKANNYDWQGEYVVTSDWLDERLVAVHEVRYSASVVERIADALTTGPMTLEVIVAALSADGQKVKTDTVRRTLQRGLTQSPKPWTVVDGSWRMVEAVGLDLSTSE